MINVIVELSKYVILTLMIVYTFHCFYMCSGRMRRKSRRTAPSAAFDHDFFIDFTAFLVIYLKSIEF